MSVNCEYIGGAARFDQRRQPSLGNTRSNFRQGIPLPYIRPRKKERAEFS